MDHRKDYLQHADSGPTSPNLTTNKRQPSAREEKVKSIPPPQSSNGPNVKHDSIKPKVLYFGDSMPNGLPLDIPGMKCTVKSYSGARVTVPKTAGSEYVPSSTLLRKDMNGDEKYVGLVIGANDVPHTNVVKFKASYRMLVKTAKSKGAKVLCHQIFHRGDRRDLNTKIDSFNNAIFQVAKEEDCAVINSTSSFNSSAWQPNVNMLVGGRLHLKQWAKRTLANRISTVIQQIDSVISSPGPSTGSPGRHTGSSLPRCSTPHSTARPFPQRWRQLQSYKYGQFDAYLNWDSCYYPQPAPYHQSSKTTWQQYPMSAGYQGEW